ncbi:hypothetical protein EXIGLDRAFT_754451 [Exidia glandulosa HHB12029]|uniref:AAA-ATPase-like domain-containing protein n=1 Tax=Exidia glandulosa HHB12029 TaxID=1314781 RepID=A0A165CX23_EXIGL|nr:hypothetical protein EXIGLDRAFT_754451 [Exidia glandulosa HHB12029]
MSTSVNDLIIAIQHHDSGFVRTPRLLHVDVESNNGLRVDELVEHLEAEWHAFCDCGRSLSRHDVWKVDLPSGQDLIALLEDIDFTDPKRATHIQPELEVPVQSVFAGALSIKGIRRLEGNVCRVSGLNQTKSIPLQPQYQRFTSQPGTLFVDKSDFISLLYNLKHNADFRISIILRYSGYGKTAFVSLLTSWFCDKRVGGRFPRPRKGLMLGRTYNDILTLVVDLERLVDLLPHGQGGTYEGISIACTTFVKDLIASFYEANKDVLRSRRPPADDAWRHTYSGLKNLLQTLNYRLSVAFDNYTAPFERVSGTATFYLEFELCALIVGPVLEDLGYFVWRGFITGRPLGNILPLTNRAMFREKTIDLTHRPDLLDIIGFSLDDVRHLGHAVTGDRNFDLTAALSIPYDHETAGQSHSVVYCARQVVDVLSRLLDGSAIEDILADGDLTPTSFSSSRLTASSLSDLSAA